VDRWRQPIRPLGIPTHLGLTRLETDAPAQGKKCRPMHDEARRSLVFVVDDEPAIAMSAALVLCSVGVDARAFTDPLAALQAAQTEPPNLLLSDVVMPGLNGYELCARVVKHCPQCKVLLFSGNPGARDNYATTLIEKSLDILPKPIPPERLMNVVRSTLEA
jgi:CheY-like chemotaxis protein